MYKGIILYNAFCLLLLRPVEICVNEINNKYYVDDVRFTIKLFGSSTKCKGFAVASAYKFTRTE